MSTAELIVEIGFAGPDTGTVLHLDDAVRGLLGTGTLGDDDVFVAVSTTVQAVSTRRGATRVDGPNVRYESGSATLVLLDPDRSLDPTNLDGPYVVAGETQVVPMRPIRLRAVWDGTAYNVWRGFIDDIRIEYRAEADAVVTLTCFDAFSVFSHYDRNASGSVGAGESTGDRIGRVLDSVAWGESDRIIADGLTTVQATTLAANAMTELYLTSDTEIGELYVDGAGRVVFRDRHAILTDTRSNTPQAIFGDGDYIEPARYDFETGTDGFTPFDCTAVQTADAYAGTGALLLTVVGSPAQAYARPPSFATEPGRQHRVTMWVRRSTGGTVQAALDFFNSGFGYISGTYPQFTLTANVWAQITATGTAPSGAAYVSAGPTLNGSPAAGVELVVDSVVVEDLSCELPYASVTVDYGRSSVYNLISIAREGGAAQVAEDAASIEKYLTRTYTRTDLIHETDEESSSHALFLLGQAAEPELRFSELSIQPRRDADTGGLLFPQALGRELGDRVTVIRRPPGGGDPIERDVFVRGVSHAISDGGQRWSTTFVLQSATRFDFLVLDSATLGVLDTDRLAF